MYEVSVKSHFSAAHCLRGYRGKCAEQHGHNWEVEVAIQGPNLDKTGMLVDFRVVKDALRKVLAEVDHRDLNKVKAFSRNNPSSENIARFIFDKLSGKLNTPRCRVHRVTVAETPENRATCQEGRP